jgi:hypothetical protein
MNASREMEMREDLGIGGNSNATSATKSASQYLDLLTGGGRRRMLKVEISRLIHIRET